MDENTKKNTMKLALRSIIHSVYPSEAACARVLGWSRQKLNKIVNGEIEPQISEVYQIARVTGKTGNEIAGIFLARWSPNGQLAS